MYKKSIKILFFLFFYIASQVVNSEELKSLNELLNFQNKINQSNSIVVMQR